MTYPLALHAPVDLFAYTGADKQLRSSVNIFLSWCCASGYTWHNANLSEYRDYALARWGLATAKKHMERIRNRYRMLLADNRFRDAVQSLVPVDATPADAYAITREIIERMQNVVNDKSLTVRLPTQTAQVDSQFRWLTIEQVAEAIESIPGNTLLALRDRAMMALAFTYALRTVDMSTVTIEDMCETVDGAGGVLVPLGKGMKQRFVFYRPETDLLIYVEEWATSAGINSGYVIRSLTPGLKVTGRRITTETVNARYNAYGFDFEPHDMRRSAARIWYDVTSNIEFVRQQLGHVHTEQSIIYLGLLRPS